jgi:CDP-2,3-bis-(O-geranylgeranyl)-sn-glycerol synthase
MLETTFETLWLFLPAMVANIAPVYFAHYNWLPQLNKPLDNYKSWRNHRLLGNNKTVRGLVSGIAAGLAIGLIQFLVSSLTIFSNISLVNYSSITTAFITSNLLAFSALMGDAIASFFKRQLNITPGQSWIPFDQIDFIISALLVSAVFVSLTPLHVFLALTIIGYGSYITSHIGVTLDIKKSL